MKLTVIALIVCVCAASVHSAAISEQQQRPLDKWKALDKCSALFGIDKTEAGQILSHRKPVKSQDGKCLMSCYMTERGYLVGGKIKWDAILAFHTAMFTSPEAKEAMESIFKMCEEKFVYKGKDECQIAYDAYTCS